MTGSEGNGPDDVDGVDLAALLLALRTRWRLLVAGLALGAALGLVAAALLGPRFVATLPVRATVSPAAGEEVLQDVDAIAAELDQLAFELDSEVLETQVVDQLGHEIELTTFLPEESTLVLLQAEASSPAVAMSAVDTAAEIVLDRRRAEAFADAQRLARQWRARATELGDNAADLSRRIADLPGEVGRSPLLTRLQRRVNILVDQKAAFEQRAAEVEIEGTTTPIGLELVDGGTAVVAPGAPTRADLVVLLGLLGLLGAVAAVWASEQHRGALVTANGLARGASWPVVDGRADEQLQLLALSLDEAADGPLPALGLVRVGADEVEVEATAVPLARALGAAGRRVSLIEGDLRDGGSKAPPGLAAYLAGSASAQDVAQGWRSPPHLVAAEAANHSNPLELARAASLGPLFAALAPDGDHDAVVLVVPDPSRRPEASPLLASVGGVVLEVALGQVRRAELTRLLGHLAMRRVSVVAVILVDGRTRRPIDGATVEANGPGARVASQLAPHVARLRGSRGDGPGATPTTGAAG